MYNKDQFKNQKVEKLIIYARARVAQGKLLKSGRYNCYIDYLQTKPLVPPLENDHIIPKHMGGSDDASNIIRINARDHALAHLLLYLETGIQGNFTAYALRKYTGHIDLSSQGKKIAVLNRLNKVGWFNSETQRQLGLKGGSIGGSKNTKAQQKARSRVGKKYGPIVGQSNQSEFVKDRLKNIIVFQHDNLPGEYFPILPCKTIIEVAQLLNVTCENRGFADLKLDLSKVRRGGVFYGLIKNQKKRAYNWTIVEIIQDD